MKKAIILLSLLLCFLIRPAGAVSYPDNIDDIKKEYPTESFLIGIGNVAASGDVYIDRTRAEILARLDIAKQIRISIKEDIIDIICAGKGKNLYSNSEECVTQLNTKVETRVSEIIEGSKNYQDYYCRRHFSAWR